MDENTRYPVKLVRLFDPEPKLMWEGKCRFHIQRRPSGDIGVITPKPDEIPISWAEYCQEDMEVESYQDPVRFVCEDYLMIVEVFGRVL
jgi:hypothetical protein